MVSHQAIENSPKISLDTNIFPHSNPWQLVIALRSPAPPGTQANPVLNIDLLLIAMSPK